MNAKQRVNKLLGYLTKWVADPRHDRRVNWERDIEKAVRKPDEPNVAAASMNLLYWANWHAQQGLFRITEGDRGGWQQLELAYRYRWWKLQLDPMLVQVAEVALLFAHALAIADREKTAWLLEYQVRSLRANQPNLWELSHFGRYGLHLHAKELPDSVDLAEIASLPHAPNMAVYAPILESWDDSIGLAAALPATLDYHLQQALTGRGYPDFEFSPYNLLPIDYLVLKNVRDRLGMSTPDCDHVLLRREWIEPPATWASPLMAPDPQVASLLDAVEVRNSPETSSTC